MASKKPTPATSPTSRPLIDPLADTGGRQGMGEAMRQFAALRPHLEDDVLIAAARPAGREPWRYGPEDAAKRVCGEKVRSYSKKKSPRLRTATQYARVL